MSAALGALGLVLALAATGDGGTVVDAGPGPEDPGRAHTGHADAGHADAAPAPSAPFSLAEFGAEQVVLVVTPTWTAAQGVLVRYEKVGAKWMQVGASVPVMVGSDGLGWGLGLHPLGVGEPRKVDGDARAVAGVYRLPMALLRVPLERMGTLPAMSPEGAVCVEDLASPSYNRILQPSAQGTAGGRALDRLDGRYDVAVLVDHNGFGSLDSTPRKGRGACALLHVWRRKGAPTDGGTAMAREDLEELVRWLDPARKPVLVQLPRDQLLHKRGLWAIP